MQLALATAHEKLLARVFELLHHALGAHRQHRQALGDASLAPEGNQVTVHAGQSSLCRAIKLPFMAGKTELQYMQGKQATRTCSRLYCTLARRPGEAARGVLLALYHSPPAYI